MTRIETFHTKTLPPNLKKGGVAAEFERDAIEHVHWMMTFIEENRSLIDPEELFYEQGTERPKTTLELAKEATIARLRNRRSTIVTHGVELGLAANVLHEV